MRNSSNHSCTFAPTITMPKHIIQAINLSISYPEIELLNSINLTLDEQEWLEILGPNGIGKTTILDAFYGMPLNLKGQLSVLDYALNPLNKEDLSALRRKIGYARQTIRLIQEKTVRANLVMALHAADRVQDFDFDTQIQDLLNKMGLGDRIKHTVNKLSVTEQHMIALARALIHKPRLLIMDQTLDYLDQEKRNMSIELIKQYQETERLTVISSSFHELGILDTSRKWSLRP